MHRVGLFQVQLEHQGIHDGHHFDSLVDGVLSKIKVLIVIHLWL